MFVSFSIEQQVLVPTCQHLPATELKKMLSIQEDASVFSSLEEDGWLNLKDLAVPYVLETLSPDIGNGEKFVFTNVETYPQITVFQPEGTYG